MQTETFEYKGREFTVAYEDDDMPTPPWKREDGHGPVSEWRPADSKRPGERVLNRNGRMCRFYDWQAAVKQAREERWGLTDKDAARAAELLGRALTPKMICAEAVRKDFERLRAWCNDEWRYVFADVALVGTDETESLGGVESDDDEYLDIVKFELAEEILYRVNARERDEIDALCEDIRG